MQVRVTVLSIHLRLNDAVAQDLQGAIYLINRATQGVDYDQLQVGSVVVGEVDDQNYMVSGAIQ